MTDRLSNIRELQQMLNQEVTTLRMNPNVNTRKPCEIILSIGFTDGFTHTVINPNKNFTKVTIEKLKESLEE